MKSVRPTTYPWAAGEVDQGGQPGPDGRLRLRRAPQGERARIKIWLLAIRVSMIRRKRTAPRP